MLGDSAILAALQNAFDGRNAEREGVGQQGFQNVMNQLLAAPPTAPASYGGQMFPTRSVMPQMGSPVPSLPQMPVAQGMPMPPPPGLLGALPQQQGSGGGILGGGINPMLLQMLMKGGGGLPSGGMNDLSAGDLFKSLQLGSLGGGPQMAF